MSTECAHDWHEYNPGGEDRADVVMTKVATFSPWIRVVSMRQCKLCYRLNFDMDYVPGEQFFAVIYSQGSSPNFPADD